MKPRFIISISVAFLLCLQTVGCGPKRLGPELTREGVLFSFYAPHAKNVAIAGSFNRWDPHRDRLSGPDKNGRWAVMLPLPPGRYEYLFIVNGTNWQTDPSMPEVDDGFGSRNSVLLVPGVNP